MKYLVDTRKGKILARGEVDIVIKLLDLRNPAIEESLNYSGLQMEHINHSLKRLGLSDTRADINHYLVVENKEDLTKVGRELGLKGGRWI